MMFGHIHYSSHLQEKTLATSAELSKSAQPLLNSEEKSRSAFIC